MTPAANRIRPIQSLKPNQLEGLQLLAGPQRHTLFVGGARARKTFLAIYAIFVRATRSPGSRHAALRFRGNAAHASLNLDTIPKVCEVCFPGLKLKFHKQDGYWEFPNGAQLWVGGLDEKERVDKILGMEFVTLFFNECSQIPWGSIETTLSRLAQIVSDTTGKQLVQRAIFDLNPVGKGHWSYLLFFKKVHPVTKQALEDASDYQAMAFRTSDNTDLDPRFISSLKRMSRRQKLRFFDGEYQDEAEGALWSIDQIEMFRVERSKLPPLTRIVVGVDPSGAGSSEDKSHDMIGIVVTGIDARGHGYVLADWSDHYSPAMWGRKVVEAFYRFEADLIVAEVNYGGAMVTHTIKTADENVPVKVITSSRGKHLRAEPVAALYEDRPEDDVHCRMHHVIDLNEDGRDHLADLEDEFAGFTTTGYELPGSPNRADAAVFGVTELMLGVDGQVWVDHFARMAGMAVSPIGPRPTDLARAAMQRYKSEEAGPAPPPITLRARGPHACYMPVGGIQYTADEDGLIHDVQPEHLEKLKGAGCIELG